MPQFALVRANGQERKVPIADLKVGDVVLVRGGEKIPVDGAVIGGQGAMIHLGPDILVFLNSVKLMRVQIKT